MKQIDRNITIAAPIASVYATSQDYGAVRYAWDPFPDRIDLVDENAPIGIGSQVDIRSKWGMTMLVEFVQVQPPTRAAIRMVKGAWWLEKFAGSWIFEAIEAEQTRVRFRYTFTMRPKILRPVMEWFANRYFLSVVDKRLAGLKRYCEMPNHSQQ